MVFLMVWKMRQQLDFQKSRAHIQALLSQKGAETEQISKAFEDLKDAFFPYDKNQKNSELKKLKEVMYGELTRGPLEITAMEDPNRRKMAGRLARGQSDLAKKETESLRGRLERLDPLERARTRLRKPAS
jgi:hypothetical protein